MPKESRRPVTGRLALLVGALAMGNAPLPAQAQLENIVRDGVRGAQSVESCEDGEKADTGRKVLGGILGGLARRTARKARLPSFAPVAEFSGELTTAIACKLDPEEQKKAAEATISATRGSETEPRPAVGSSASWESESRDEVSGTSTVTGVEELSEDADCITVTDVVIVKGEETRAEKRMCRPPGSARYSIVA